MNAIDPPLVSALVAIYVGVLMVQAGIGKRMLAWRSDSERRRGRRPAGSAATARQRKEPKR